MDSDVGEAMAQTGFHVGSDGGIEPPASSAQPPQVMIEVADTGSGMDPEAMAKIFEPYFSTKTGGTGLGLTIAKRNVELNGGTIAVSDDSAPAVAWIDAEDGTVLWRTGIPAYRSLLWYKMREMVDVRKIREYDRTTQRIVWFGYRGRGDSGCSQRVLEGLFLDVPDIILVDVQRLCLVRANTSHKYLALSSLRV